MILDEAEVWWISRVLRGGLLEVERWSGWMRRMLLWGVAACGLKIWPPQLRWSGAGPGSGAAGARGASPADGPSSSLHPVRRIWCILRLFKAFEHGVLPFPGGVILAVVPFVVPDGGGLARQVISWLKMKCDSSSALCFSYVFFVLVSGCVMVSLTYEYKY